MVLLRIALLLFFANITCACDSINLGAISYHFDRSKEYNERHHMIGCTNVIGQLDVLWFRNSKRNNSLFIGNYKPLFVSEKYQFGFDYGLITGYEWAVTPLILPKAIYNGNGYKLNVYMLFDAGIAAGLEIDL